MRSAQFAQVLSIFVGFMVSDGSAGIFRRNRVVWHSSYIHKYDRRKHFLSFGVDCRAVPHRKKKTTQLACRTSTSGKNLEKLFPA